MHEDDVESRGAGDRLRNPQPHRDHHRAEGFGGCFPHIRFLAMPPRKPEELDEALARLQALRDAGDVPMTVTDDEWAEFQAHFDKRKVELGSCGRPYDTI